MVDRERRNLIFAHQEWLGFVQPVGLVVSPNVMVDAQVVPDRNISDHQRAFREILEEDESGATASWRAPDLRQVFLDYLGWEEGDLQEVSDHREALEISLPELQAVLSPTWAVPGDGDQQWAMLARVEDNNADLDKPPDDGSGWNASRHARFERLLRETGIPVGLLCTDEHIRLVHAPKGESSGHVTFEFSQMALPAGRPILSAFNMLLSADALFGGDPDARLPSLLARSRDAQAEVSTKLSRQVLAALHELLRGFVSAGAWGGGATATKLAQRKPEHLYGGLITTLMRLVFVLYAEDRGLMPDHRVYQQHYSLVGLFARLRADAAAWPDIMDQRFGAWAQMLSLFRLIHSGGGHADLSFVARKGTLFDPDRFPFLEGRETKENPPDIPMIPDATVWKVLQSLMVLDGERLSYRTLDVEQVGSVYEAIMGFRIELTTGQSIAVVSQKRTGAAVIVDIDSLLEIEGGKRTQILQDATDRKLKGDALAALRNASVIADVIVALERVVDRDVTPDIVPAGTPVLQPTNERRRSGSHYTPRSLTEPIVSEALRPIFKRLGPNARPEDILDLKILDPATGSGAFLVEACRQLSVRLTQAWNTHGGRPDLSDDEDDLLHARRLVARRCLYGVDRNPMAIELARLSLWLVTLARDHEFTFIDHALRHGDSLVGLTRKQIEEFNFEWRDKKFQLGTETWEVKNNVTKVSKIRQMIREFDSDVPEQKLRKLQDEADSELKDVNQVANLVLTAFFEGKTSKEREKIRVKYADLFLKDSSTVTALFAETKLSIVPFHWELEFPEVYDRENPGFDTIVGNPPFAGKNTLAAANTAGYPGWLKHIHAESHGNADLVAHFFRRAFNLLRIEGTFGLIATNTIGQGDTRSTGLRWICKNGGDIYCAQRRLKWPGEAAVVVSVIHVFKGTYAGPRTLNGKNVEIVSAFLFHTGSHDDPERLEANSGKSFIGSFIYGSGFTFDDADRKGIATSLSEMHRLIERNPRNQDIIFPYIGGDEVSTSPAHGHRRYVINFRNWPLRRDKTLQSWFCDDQTESCRKRRNTWLREGIVPGDYPEQVATDWPELLAIVEEKVRPARAHLTNNAIGRRRKKFWWQYGSLAKEGYITIANLDRVLAINCGAVTHVNFSFLPSRMIYAHTLAIFSLDGWTAFCVLQSYLHEIWARFFGSTLGDGLRYTPSDCFETFPFPVDWEKHSILETSGKMYYDFRATLMIENDEGLTDTYNRFHDPDECDPHIERLRQLHTAMDRAVLDAYGWSDIPTDCEFLLDYEIDEETWGRKKKPWRYRWPDEIRDEVLARLLALNAERAAEERMAEAGISLPTGNPKAAS